MSYKHSNGRIQHRGAGGRFQKVYLDAGLSTAKRPRVCSCGHEWEPILTTGCCPKCNAQASKPAPLTEEEQAKLAEYKAFGPFVNPATVHQQQALWEWLNERGIFE